MAFSSTITAQVVMGSKYVNYGTWDGGGDNGGNIDTGLHKVEHISLTAKGSAPAAAPAVNEVLPYDGSAITIACGANVDGYWMAWGY